MNSLRFLYIVCLKVFAEREISFMLIFLQLFSVLLLGVPPWWEYYKLFDKVFGFVGVSWVFFLPVKSYLNTELSSTVDNWYSLAKYPITMRTLERVSILYTRTSIGVSVNFRDLRCQSWVTWIDCGSLEMTYPTNKIIGNRCSYQMVGIQLYIETETIKSLHHCLLLRCKVCRKFTWTL